MNKPWWALPMVGAGFGIIALAMLALFFLTPCNERGRPLQKYWNNSPSAAGHEVLYVCEDTKTYFRRVWAHGSSRL